MLLSQGYYACQVCNIIRNVVDAKKKVSLYNGLLNINWKMRRAENFGSEIEKNLHYSDASTMDFMDG